MGARMIVKSLGKFEGKNLPDETCILFEESGVEIKVGANGYIHVRYPHRSGEGSYPRRYRASSADSCKPFFHSLSTQGHNGAKGENDET